MDNKEKQTESAEPKVPLTPEDQHEIELFIQNSQGYSQKVYGGKTFCDEEIDDLRQEIKDKNEAVKKVREEWGVS